MGEKQPPKKRALASRRSLSRPMLPKRRSLIVAWTLTWSSIWTWTSKMTLNLRTQSAQGCKITKNKKWCKKSSQKRAKVKATTPRSKNWLKRTNLGIWRTLITMLRWCKTKTRRMLSCSRWCTNCRIMTIGQGASSTTRRTSTWHSLSASYSPRQKSARAVSPMPRSMTSTKISRTKL